MDHKNGFPHQALDLPSFAIESRLLITSTVGLPPMASIWKGSLTFGLVHVPVEMKTAVRSDHISFRMLHAEDLSPIKYDRVCQADGEPVPWNEIVKGYEYTKGKFVVLTDEDFKKAALDSSRTIDIIDFVREDEIDARFFETPYYLLPTKGGDKPYALLREAGVVGIGKVIIRRTQHLAGVRVVGEALVLELMRFANELVDIKEYSFPGTDALREQELTMAKQLVENLAEPFDPEKYTDDYRSNLMKLIRAKMKGKKVTAAEPLPEDDDTTVLDLMSRLQASLEEGRAAKGGRGKKRVAKSEGRSNGSRGRAKRPA
jgi:DNA end-binding protein Ku